MKEDSKPEILAILICTWSKKIIDFILKTKLFQLVKTLLPIMTEYACTKNPNCVYL
jgi:hypothetical protein